MTWPLGDEELLLLSVNTLSHQAAEQGPAARCTQPGSWSCHTRGSVCMGRAQLQQCSPAWDIKQAETTGSPSKGARLCGHPAEQSPQGPSTMVFCSCGHTWFRRTAVNAQSTWQMGRICRYFLSCSECQKTKSKVIRSLNRV